MRLSVYLFREGAVDFDQLLRMKYRAGGDAFEIVEPAQQLSFECRALVQVSRAKEPKWKKFLEPTFDLHHLNLESKFNSFILFIRAKDRVFGLTFGRGFHAIEAALVEPDFGLRVTLNDIDPGLLDTMDTRNIDLVTRQRRTHMNTGSPLFAFGVSPDADWIRMVSGVPRSDTFAKRLAGADGLQITLDCDLPALHEKCERLLELFLSEDYKKSFAFIDNLRPVKDKDPILRSLDQELARMLQSAPSDQLALAHPELPENAIESYRIFSGRYEGFFDHLHISEIFKFLNDNPGADRDPNSIFLVGLDSGKAAVTPKNKLKLYLVAQLQRAPKTYVLSLGHWFRVDTTYLETLRRRVSEIPDLTKKLHLPAMLRGEDEVMYNRRVASLHKWVNLDRSKFNFKTRHDQIEVCDLLTSKREFICVKKMESSATLSHLFAQASVSATLFNRLEPYRTKIRKSYEAQWPKKNFDDAAPITFVYAIVTDKTGSLADDLFFFSLVNLLPHVETIRSAGFKVALCKIDAP